MLGKANMHELAFGITTTNFSPFAGFARNPYDTNRMVGGSSGGTGVAIAARMAPVGCGAASCFLTESARICCYGKETCKDW